MGRRRIVAWVAQAVAYSADINVTHFAISGSTKSAKAAKAKAKAKIEHEWPNAELRRMDSEPIREGD